MDFQGFSKDICRSMVAMMDVDGSGKLKFEEFNALLTDIAQWKVSGFAQSYTHNKVRKLFISLRRPSSNFTIATTLTRSMHLSCVMLSAQLAIA